MNNKNVSVWRGDNIPPTLYHLWLKNDGKLYVNIDEQWLEIDKDSVALITETLNQHATKLDNHLTALDDINTLHSKLWTTGKGNYSVMTLGVASVPDSSNKYRAGNFSLAEGLNTVAEGICSHAEGDGCRAILTGAHAEGITSTADGFGAHAENNSIANGRFSHSEGSSLANGTLAHAEGHSTKASQEASHAEGSLTKAMAMAAHAEGFRTEANTAFSHAEGMNTSARGEGAHSEGYRTSTGGNAAHAEGFFTAADGAYSHAEGSYTKAIIDNAHALGRYNIASDLYLHSIGIGTKALRKNSEYVYFNPYVESDTKNGYKYLIGIGGYDGISIDVDTYKSLLEVISDVDSTLKVKADLVDGKIPLELLGNLDMVLFEVVKELPTTNIKKHIYLMKVSELESGTKNLYAEYIYTGDITAAYDASKWEKLGVKLIETDLSDYYTKEETDSLIQAVKNKFPLQIDSFTVSPNVCAVGTTNVTLKWAYNNEDINPITSQSLNDITLDKALRTKTESVSSDTATTKTFTLKANALSKTVTVYIVNNSYYGVVSANTTTITDTTGLKVSTQYGAAATIAFTQANLKIVYLYPSTFGDLTSIKDLNGFEGISGFEKQSITLNGVSYNLYISKIPATSNVTLTFK